MSYHSNQLQDIYGFDVGSSRPAKNLDYKLINQTEQLWIDYIQTWDSSMIYRFSMIKDSCRNGIPHIFRPVVWQLLSGSFIFRARDYGFMETFVSKEGDAETIDIIQRDLHRNYADHILFKDKDGQGQADLFKILKAYSILRPIKGYCQAFGPLAGFYLINMTLLDAFWMFTTINDKYIPGYCMEDMDAVEIDCLVTMALLQTSCPIAYKHLNDLEISPMIWMVEWYVTLYTRLLPWPTLLRVWDMFLCEGVKVIFAVALTLVKLALGTKEKVDAAPGLYECMMALKKIPDESNEESIFIPLVLKSYISGSILAKEQKKQMKIWLKARKIREENKASNNHNNSASRPLEKLSICREPSKTPTLPLPQRQDASTDTAADQTTALLARMPAAGDMDGNGVSGGVCGDIADDVEDDDECGYDDSEDIGNNIVDGECGDYKDSINEVAIENK